MWTYAGKSHVFNIKNIIIPKLVSNGILVFQQAVNNKEMPFRHELARLHRALYISD
jgi:hypothetical protein